jgi:hypothetical protein
MKEMENQERFYSHRMELHRKLDSYRYQRVNDARNEQTGKSPQRSPPNKLRTSADSRRQVYLRSVVDSKHLYKTGSTFYK